MRENSPFDFDSYVLKEKYGPVGLVHVDAHSDTNDLMFGERVTHGTPFRRAVEEGLLDSMRVVQIGLRGSGYTPTDFKWAEEQVPLIIQQFFCRNITFYMVCNKSQYSCLNNYSNYTHLNRKIFT